MYFIRDSAHPLLMPVRRKLCFVVVSWLLGILTVSVCGLPYLYGFIGAALAVGMTIYLQRKAIKKLPAVMLMMFCLGFAAAGYPLQTKALPTKAGVSIEGTVSFVQDEKHVFLEDVTVDGLPWESFGVRVTLMRETYDDVNTGISILPGQKINGTGRLFTQRDKRNPGGYDNRVNTLCDGYELSGYILPGWSVTNSGHFSIRQELASLRARLIDRLQQIFGDDAPLFEAVLMGDRSDMAFEDIVSMRLTGIVHILTVSGMHLSLLAALLSELLRKLRLHRGIRSLLLALLLAFYTLLTGGAAGTVRALIMRLLSDIANLRGKRYDALTGLAAAAFLMTLFKPLWVLNTSFQFSFYTVLGLLLLCRSIMAFFERFVPAKPIWLTLPLLGFVDTVAVSVSAQLSCLPMQALAYGYVPLLSLPMNLICSVLILPILYGGACTLGVSFLNLHAAQLLAIPLGFISKFLQSASDFLAAQPLAILRIPAPFTLAVLVFPLLMMLLSRRIAFGHFRRKAALLLGACLAISFAVRFIPKTGYVQLDVGQGDAAIVRSGRHAVLVDVGESGSYDVMRYLRHEGLFVDAIVLSHFDNDHAGALKSLLNSEIIIPRIICPSGVSESEIGSQAVLDALANARDMGIPIEETERGAIIDFGMYSFDVLSPDDTLSGENERSLVLYTEIEGTKFLLAGDLPIKSERDDFPDVDVLKVAHHGSKNATSAKLIDHITPEIALISVGEGNSYGHPTQRVLDDLQNADAAVLRTDKSGCLTLWLSKNKRFIHTFL